MEKMTAPVVFDCGARGGPHRSWRNYPAFFKYYGFEPDMEEVEKINQIASTEQFDYYVIPQAVSDREAEMSFYLYGQRDVSSVFKIDPKYTYRYSDTQIEETSRIVTTTISNIVESEHVKPHFLNIDVQGGTLAVLKGCGSLLNCSILGVRCEVEFTPMYIGAPLVTDVYGYLLTQGFRVVRLETCGSGAFGVSSDMNGYSVSPADGLPVYSDLVAVNDKLVDELIYQSDAPSLIKIANVALYCLYNGAGFYGAEILLNTVKRNDYRIDWMAIGSTLNEIVLSNFAAYFSIPRSNINNTFDASQAFQEIFGLELSSYSAKTYDILDEIYGVHRPTI